MKQTNGQPREWKLVSLREYPIPEEMQICDEPEQAAGYWEADVTNHPDMSLRALGYFSLSKVARNLNPAESFE